jgi:hypothetical protein
MKPPSLPGPDSDALAVVAGSRRRSGLLMLGALNCSASNHEALHQGSAKPMSGGTE